MDDRFDAWYEFRLCTFEEGDWVENCRGQVSIEYEKQASVVDGGKEAKEETHGVHVALQNYLHRCDLKVASAEFYTKLESWGFGLGEPFQKLRDISFNNEGNATATVDLFRDTSDVLGTASQPCVVHPVTLDGILQLVFPSLTRGGSREIPTMVPTRVRKLWVSNFGLNSQDAEQVTGYSEAKLIGNRGADSTIIALDKSNGEPRVKVEGFETTAVVDPNSTVEKVTERRLCYSVEWKPDLDMLSRDQILVYCNEGNPSISQPVDFCQDLEILCFSYMSDVLERSKKGNVSSLQPHLVKYLQWIERRITSSDARKLQIGQRTWHDLSKDQCYQNDLHKRLRGSNSQGDFYIEVAKNLNGIFQGEVDVLNLLFGGDLVSNFYRDAEGPWNCMRSLMKYLDSLAHKNPAMHILEIGAGTGGATAPVLDILRLHGDREHGVPRFQRYDYTDISPSFFEKAKELFKEYGDRLQYKTLDIEKDPMDQGYSAGTYDVVFAANVIHATKDLSTTLQNARKLLKPEGKLVLLEVCNPELLRTGFAFGLLSGWWVSTEETRQWSPILFEKDWHELLTCNGFSGTDMTFRDYEDDRCHETSIMVSTAVEPLPKEVAIPQTAIIMSENPSILQKTLAQRLSTIIKGKNASECHLMSATEAASYQALAEIFCISILEIDDSYFKDNDFEGFEALKMMLKTSKGIIWVTHGGGLSPKKPEMDIVTGLLRSSRTEYAESILIQLSIETPTPIVEREAEIIYQVLEITVKSPPETCETEFTERDGMLYINRLIESKGLNADIHAKTLERQAALREIRDCPPIQLSIGSPGLLDTLEYVDDPVNSEHLAADEIEVEVKACGVNFRDILIALGRYNDNTLGSECAGIVREVGSGVCLKPGDRVCLCVLGTYKTSVRCKAYHAAKIPDVLSFVEAAGLPTTSATAYYALHEIARLAIGESVLIHSAAGGTGQAAIQMAKLVDAEIYATVGSEEKKKFLIDSFDIAEDHIFDSRDLTFARGIMRMTGGRGVDVVLNSLSGEGLIASWESIAPFGRFIEIGKKDIESHGKLPMHRFAKNVSFTAVDLAHITRDNPGLLSKLLAGVMSLVSTGKLRSSRPLHTYQASRVEEAFRFLQGGKNSGKTVVEISMEDIIPVSRCAFFGLKQFHLIIFLLDYA